MMKKELIVNDLPELKLIEASKAEQIRLTFEPMAKMVSNFEDSYDEIILEAEKEITKDVISKAKRLRIDIGKVRIQTEKVRKEQKEEYLRAGKAIDGVSNILKWAVSDKENKLKEIEDHFEIQEQKRLEALQIERVNLLSNYVDDAQERDLSGMDDDVWNAYFESKKKDYEDKIAAEKKAEVDRIAKEKAEAKEHERIRKENERLKKEAEERDRLAKIEAEKRDKEEAKRKAKEEAESKVREEKERKEREAFEAKIKAEREERERIECEERIKREKLEAELKAKKEAEIKAKEEEEAMIQAELSKGDSDKVKDLFDDLKSLKNKYSFKSVKNKRMYIEVGKLIDHILDIVK